MAMDVKYVMLWYGIEWCEAMWCGMQRKGVKEGKEGGRKAVVGREEERRKKGGREDRRKGKQ